MTDGVHPATLVQPTAIMDNEEVIVWSSGLVSVPGCLSIGLFAQEKSSPLYRRRPTSAREVAELTRSTAPQFSAKIMEETEGEVIDLWQGVTSGSDPHIASRTAFIDLPAGHYTLAIEVTGGAFECSEYSRFEIA